MRLLISVSPLAPTVSTGFHCCPSQINLVWYILCNIQYNILYCVTWRISSTFVDVHPWRLTNQHFLCSHHCKTNPHVAVLQVLCMQGDTTIKLHQLDIGSLLHGFKCTFSVHDGSWHLRMWLMLMINSQSEQNESWVVSIPIVFPTCTNIDIKVTTFTISHAGHIEHWSLLKLLVQQWALTMITFGHFSSFLFWPYGSAEEYCFRK